MGPADREIHELLRAMGLTRVYRGYGYLFYILRRGLDDPQWLVSGNKQVFLDTARAFAAALMTVSRLWAGLKLPVNTRLNRPAKRAASVSSRMGTA